MNIGKNLRELREKKGITQHELAEKVQVARPTLSQLERGTRTLTLPLAKEIAEVLDCDVNDFLKED